MKYRFTHQTLLLLSFLFEYSPLSSQYLVSAQYLGSRTEAELTASFGQPVRSSVEMFKILYMTTDVHGMGDTASGLLIVPDATLNGRHPIVIYQHGTTNGPADAPSRLAAGTTESLAFGGMGYITMAPDYLGLGDNMAFHPYVHAASEAWAARDMLFAVTEFIEAETGEPWADDLFISGYSQGGHAAAAIQRELEENWSLVYPVTASAPMSGPYSISGVMYDKVVGNEVYFLPAYIAYVVLAYQEVYGNLYATLDEIFKPAYVPIMQSFRNNEINTTTMNILLVNQLFLEAGTSRPRVMFKADVLQEITEDVGHPFRVALRDNDVFDWTPVAPTRLYYCTADEQVPFQNTIVADSVMRANGAADVEAVNMGNLNHGNCAAPAIRASITFFDGFVLPSSLSASPTLQDMAIAYPNPVSGTLYLDTEYTASITGLRITDLSGRTVFSTTPVQREGIDIAFLPAGIFIIQIFTEDIQLRQRIIVMK